MLFLDQYSQRLFLAGELKRQLPEGSFASRLRRTIGAELHYRLVDWPFENETEYSRYYPVDALFFWVTEKEGLDPEWLACDDGTYLDDDGGIIPATVRPSYSPVEQLAAYGLWLLSEEFVALGPTHGEDADIGPLPEYNIQGWERSEVIEHRTACLLFAYQALAYSQRLLAGAQLSVEERRKAETLHFSILGKAGAQKRHAPMAELRSWAIAKYQETSWRSANQAAHALKDAIIEHGRALNAHLSEENAQRTIAEWFRKCPSGR
jgi:hypothetical protein